MTARPRYGPVGRGWVETSRYARLFRETFAVLRAQGFEVVNTRADGTWNAAEVYRRSWTGDDVVMIQNFGPDNPTVAFSRGRVFPGGRSTSGIHGRVSVSSLASLVRSPRRLAAYVDAVHASRRERPARDRRRVRRRR